MTNICCSSFKTTLINFSNSIFSIRFVMKKTNFTINNQMSILFVIQFILIFEKCIYNKFNVIFYTTFIFQKLLLKKRFT